MEISSLQAFVAVAESSSFSRAGERLFLSQPAVSKRIAALESELDTRLFDRLGREVILTEAGRLLLPRARRVIGEITDSRRLIANLSGEVGGRLSIGTSHHIGLHRLPPVLRRFTHDYPKVELDLHFMDSEVACRAVERGKLELAVVTLPEQTSEKLTIQIVWPDPLDIVVAPNHPLAEIVSVPLPMLVQHAAILPAHGTFTREILERALRPQNVSLKIALETNYLETIKMLVSVGLGWSTLPRHMIQGELVALRVGDLGLVRNLGLVQHQARTPTNAGKAFMECVLGDKKG